jgi:hypothetical protein
MGELYYPRAMTSMFQNSPTLKFLFDLLLYNIVVSQTLNSNILANLNILNILGYESGAQMGLIDEKNQR